MRSPYEYDVASPEKIRGLAGGRPVSSPNDYPFRDKDPYRAETSGVRAALALGCLCAFVCAAGGAMIAAHYAQGRYDTEACPGDCFNGLCDGQRCRRCHVRGCCEAKVVGTLVFAGHCTEKPATYFYLGLVMSCCSGAILLAMLCYFGSCRRCRETNCRSCCPRMIPLFPMWRRQRHSTRPQGAHPEPPPSGMELSPSPAQAGRDVRSRFPPPPPAPQLQVMSPRFAVSVSPPAGHAAHPAVRMQGQSLRPQGMPYLKVAPRRPEARPPPPRTLITTPPQPVIVTPAAPPDEPEDEEGGAEGVVRAAACRGVTPSELLTYLQQQHGGDATGGKAKQQEDNVETPPSDRCFPGTPSVATPPAEAPSSRAGLPTPQVGTPTPLPSSLRGGGVALSPSRTPAAPASLSPRRVDFDESVVAAPSQHVSGGAAEAAQTFEDLPIELLPVE